MKSLIASILFLCLPGFHGLAIVYTVEMNGIPGRTSFQEAPFYFLNPVPAKIIRFSNINLSFFRNQVLVHQYRYKLEIPEGSQQSIPRSLINWSAWVNFDMSELIVPRLELEGGYKLMIEYRTKQQGDVKKFEQYFFVYRGYPVAPAGDIERSINLAEKQVDTKPAVPTIAAGSLKTGKSGEQPAELVSVATETNNKGENVSKTETAILDSTLIDPLPKLVTDSISVPIMVGSDSINGLTGERDQTVTLPVQPPPIDLSDAISKSDTSMIRLALSYEAGLNIDSAHGGNIFHLIDEKSSNTLIFRILKQRGFSINEPDTFGNTPLHLATLKGNLDYASLLISEGADPDRLNNDGLSPLHIAVMLNDAGLTEKLLANGATVDLKGNSGYTPLHIASELNHITMAIKLLDNNASTKVKTGQSLSPAELARIQDNTDMSRLIARKGAYTVNLTTLAPQRVSIVSNVEARSYPVLDFNLQYDPVLASKRRLNKVIQTICVPVFGLAGGSALFFKSRADHFYSLSKSAESEVLARQYYDKTKTFDNLTYISGGVSLVTIYTFIHSSMKKKLISVRMHKDFAGKN